MKARVSNQDFHSSSASATSCMQNFRRAITSAWEMAVSSTGREFIFIMFNPNCTISYLHQRAPGYSSPRRLFGSASTSCSGKPWTRLAAVAQRPAGESASKRGRETGSMTFLQITDMPVRNRHCIEWWVKSNGPFARVRRGWPVIGRILEVA